ncbi:MAG TPA: 16S rRNA (cytidine(1402)-2'-O)-methyltransferase [Candidatus Paceibacterota bacterium]|jgi:16S rRNA (cytidine1402-2'-O)-methyltransferase
MPRLYVVATPIGNLEDVTLRALRVLKEADVIVCEDTRVTKKLLGKYHIATPLESMNARTEEKKIQKVLGFLREEKNIALVSDAGTPTISDPGTRLVSMVRRELPDVEIVSIPGPSALTSALSVSGIPAADFLFLGFLPHKKGREKLFKEIAGEKRAVVFYESPHRIEKALASLAEHLGSRKVVLARELTKIHEEVIEGTATLLLAHLAQNKEKIRGEFVVLVFPQ